MSVFANAQLMYCLTDQDDNTEELFDFLEQNAELDPEDDIEDDQDDDSDIRFEDIRTDLQQQYHVTLKQINHIKIISAFSVSASGKSFDMTEVNNIDLKRADDYRSNIVSFLQELNVPYPQQYRTSWRLFAYAN